MRTAISRTNALNKFSLVPTGRQSRETQNAEPMARQNFTQPVVWVTTLFMVVFHIGALAALFVFTWKTFLLSMVLWWVAASGLGWDTIGS